MYDIHIHEKVENYSLKSRKKWKYLLRMIVLESDVLNLSVINYNFDLMYFINVQIYFILYIFLLNTTK